LAITFVILILLNACVPFIPGDDFLYHFRFDFAAPADRLKIDGISDLMHSIKHHYLVYNNRIFPHAILQTVLLLGKPMFNIINAACFLMLPYAVLSISQIKPKLNNYWKLFFLIFCFIWSFHFDLGMSYFWTTGSVNYTWMLILQLLLISRLTHQGNNEGRARWVLLFLSLLVATTNEHIVLSIFILSLYTNWNFYKTHRSMSMPMMVSSMILLLGGLIMLFSPALHARNVNEAIGFASNVAHLKEFVLRQGFTALHFLPLLFFFPFRGMKTLDISPIDYLLIFMVVFSNWMLVLAPLVEPRTAVFGFVLMIAVLIKIIHQSRLLNLEYIKPRLALFVIISIGLLYLRTSDFIRINEMQNDNMSIISSLQNKDARIPGLYISKRYASLYSDDYISDPEYVDNKMAAKFYGTASLAVDTSIKIDRHARWDNLSKLIVANPITPARFTPIKINAKLLGDLQLDSIYYRVKGTKEQSLEWIIKTDQTASSKGLKLITRGSKSKWSALISGLLPSNVSLSTMDYLDFDRASIVVDGSQYYYNYITSVQDYEYLMLSLYDPSLHKAIGVPYQLRIKDLLDAE